MLYLWSAPKEVIAINKFESGKVASFEFVTEVVWLYYSVTIFYKKVLLW